MTDYTKVTNFTAKDTNNDTILGSDFETELSAVQTMSTTKSNKVGAPTTNNLAKLSGTGDLLDSGLATAQTPQLDDANAWVEKQTFNKVAVFDTVVDNSSGGSKTIDWTVGNKQKYTLTSNGTLTFTAPGGPCNLVLLIVNSGAARTITWPAGVVWPSGVKPVATASGDIDVYTFFYSGAAYYGGGLMDMS